MRDGKRQHRRRGNWPQVHEAVWIPWWEIIISAYHIWKPLDTFNTDMCEACVSNSTYLLTFYGMPKGSFLFYSHCGGMWFIQSPIHRCLLRRGLDCKLCALWHSKQQEMALLLFKTVVLHLFEWVCDACTIYLQTLIIVSENHHTAVGTVVD